MASALRMISGAVSAFSAFVTSCCHPTAPVHTVPGRKVAWGHSLADPVSLTDQAASTANRHAAQRAGVIAWRECLRRNTARPIQRALSSP